MEINNHKCSSCNVDVDCCLIGQLNPSKHDSFALCAACLTEMLAVFDRPTRLRAAEKLQEVQMGRGMPSNFCDDDECESCNGVGADGHIS